MKKRELFNKKEIEILKLIATGYATPEIGEKLKYTAGTIDNYVKDMMLKTNTVNRAHLVFECAKQGYIK